MISKLIRFSIAALALGALALLGCALPNMPEFTADSGVQRSGPADDSPEPATGPDSNQTSGGAAAYEQAGDSFTISWDAPSAEVEYFRVYYREHPDGAWVLLDEVAAGSENSYTIESHRLPAGTYDLGVSSVDSANRESKLHTSRDPTADPPSGWYVEWDPPR